jgi:hypothetical protein
VQFELCKQFGEQIANQQMICNLPYYQSLFREYSRVLHILSFQPVVQLQTSGYVQFPFTQPDEHIATWMRIEK